MMPNLSLDDLAARMQRRVESTPYILFLGEGCAREAGAPSRLEIARQALGMFAPNSVSSSNSKSDAAIFEEFSKLTTGPDKSSLVRMLRMLHARVPVPSFYQYLALLVREGYFPLIMTMNFDTLLEQALANAGTRSSEYRVTTFAEDGKLSSQQQQSYTSPPLLTHIVKLHGDLAQNVAQITPDEIESALQRSRSWIKADLTGDMIMIEHVLSDDPIDSWLRHFPQRELWWVAQRPPTDVSKVRTWSSELQMIIGEMGRPQVFFPQLALRLLRTAAVSGIEADQTSGELAGSEKVQAESRASEPLADTLHNEILRNQSVLYSLEQEGVAGQRSPELENQIAYHKQQSFRLEDRLRSLPQTQSLVVDCVKRIGEQIREKGSIAISDPSALKSTVNFIDLHRDTLEEELKKKSPNQFVVAGALGATLTVADRLVSEYGSSVVDAEDVRSLASLAPTVAGKVVL